MAGAVSTIKLKVDTREYNNQLTGARQGLLALESTLQQAGKSFTACDKSVQQYVREIGNMETKSRGAQGRIAEMTKTFMDLSALYNRLSQQDKQSEFGRGLQQSLDRLKPKIIEAKNEMRELQQQLEPTGAGAGGGLGGFSNALGEIGSQLGVNSNLMQLVTTGTLGYVAAIGAAAAGVAAATKAFVDFNSELARQDQITGVVTGLQGTDADRLTDGVRAIARTYDVDFREAVEAANTLMQQFGKSGDEALVLLRDGMRGMIQGDGGKLLTMIQQYAPAFRMAGVSAAQLVAVIQNSEGGLFTDENMQSILRGVTMIREMRDTTSKALKQIGIDGQEMSEKLATGEMTVFEALQEVARKMQELGEGSKETGEVMRAVFGRQGASAGTKLAEAIANLNTNLAQTKTQTGEVGQSFAQLETATENLERAMRDAFGFQGWEVMKNQLQTGLLTVLTDVVRGVESVRKSFLDLNQLPFRSPGESMLTGLKTAALGLISPLHAAVGLLHQLGGMSNSKGLFSRLGGYMGDKLTQIRAYAESARSVGGGGAAVVNTSGGGGRNGRSGGGERSVVAEKSEEQKIQEQINKLVEEAYTADENRRQAIRDEVAKLQKQLEKYKAIKDSVLGVVKTQKEVQYESTTGGFTQANATALQQMLQGRLGNVAMGSAEYAAISRNLADLSALTAAIQKAVKAGLEIPQEDVQALWETIFNGDALPEGALDFITSKLPKTAAKKADPIDIAAKVSGSLNTIVGGLEQLGVDVPRGLQSVISGIQVLTGIVSAISALVSLINAKETVSMVAGLVPVMAGGGVVPKAAGGWTVPGRSFSNDRVPILANSGEVVLNRAEVGNLSSQLQDAGGGFAVSARIDGEDLLIAINRASVRRGRGTVAMT